MASNLGERLGLPTGKNFVYKIRRKSDGLFSGGGTWYVKFSKRGKIWKQLNHLTSHLNQVDSATRRMYDECEIVCYEVVEKPVGGSVTITEYLNEREQLEREKELRAQQRQEQAEKEARFREYEKLKAEFE